MTVTVDDRIREGVTLISDQLPPVDIEHALQVVTRHGRPWWQRPASLVAAVAALILIGGTLVVTLVQDGTDRSNGVTTPPEPTGLPLMHDGPLDPGRYRYVLNPCGDPPVDCPTGIDPPSPVNIDVTVPAGWQQLPGYPNVITPQGTAPTAGPDGAGLVLGWTNIWARLYSDPCLPPEDEGADLSVGASVDDFVAAVQAHELLDVTKPADVQIGGHPGSFFRLRTPSDLSGCDKWRPWDPGFYAQGPGNIWDVWVLDVDGLRVVIVTDLYAGTPPKVRRELQEMVESMSIGPS